MWMVKNDHAAFLGDHPGRMSWTKLQQLGGGRMPKTVQMDVGWPRKIGVFLILRLVGVMKNLQPQTGPGQNSFFSFFYHFGYHYIHHLFYHLFYHLHFFYHFRYHVFIMFLIIFLSFFHFFFIFLSFFINFASSGAKILQEMENYNFPRVFSFHER